MSPLIVPDVGTLPGGRPPQSAKGARRYQIGRSDQASSCDARGDAGGPLRWPIRTSDVLDRRTASTREAGLVYGVEAYELMSSCVAPDGSSGPREAHAPSGYWRDSQLTNSRSRAGSVLVLDLEEGTANSSGQPRLLPRELEPRGELRGDFHPFGELEPDRPLRGGVDGVHHVDR